jgi:hypothetical protein
VTDKNGLHGIAQFLTRFHDQITRHQKFLGSTKCRQSPVGRRPALAWVCVATGLRF